MTNFALFQNAAPLTSGTATRTVRIFFGILALILVILMIFRRGMTTRKGAAKKEEDDV